MKLRLQVRPFKASADHKPAVVGTVVGPDGKPARDALVLAMPVGAGSLFQAAAHTLRDGSFRLTLPSQGVYDLFAVEPGQGGVGAAAVGTLTEGTARVEIHLPSWQGRRYVVVLQQGLAYTGKPVWVWGNFPGEAPDLALEAMPGVQTLLTVHLPAKNGHFTWSGVLGTQPQQYENLTATYAIKQGTDLAAAFTLPGVPTGTNGNANLQQNIAPYHLAWGSLSEAGGKVRFDIGGSSIASPWGLSKRPGGQVSLPVGIGSPWAETVAYMPMAIPSQPLLSVYDVEGGPLVPPKDSWLGGFRLSSGRDFPLGLQGAQLWSVDMLTTSAGWATTRDNQVLYTSDGGALTRFPPTRSGCCRTTACRMTRIQGGESTP
ncbi:MAG: carboxypeptidase-like regulatory domain-containing protein [Thermaerobacter sp.]|nr:carboxypeptidase-like regulatory domain-containing protein [Thermaerobacter sp.]